MDAPFNMAKPTISGGQDVRDDPLIAIVDQLARELHPQQARSASASLSSRLERDLGIDSLGRTELVLRLERAFGKRLPIALSPRQRQSMTCKCALEQAGAAQAPRWILHRTALPLPAISAATEATTLIDVLEWHVSQHPDRLHVTVLEDERTVLGRLTYGELAKTSRAIASGLIERDIMPGDRVALMLPTSVDSFRPSSECFMPVPFRFRSIRRCSAPRLNSTRVNRRNSCAMLACGCW